MSIKGPLNSSAVDERAFIDQDQLFIGVNERIRPGALPDGYCHSAKNMRFVDGTVQTRKGIAAMKWDEGYPLTQSGVGLADPGYESQSSYEPKAIRSAVYINPEDNSEWIVTLWKGENGELLCTRSAPGNSKLNVNIPQGYTAFGDFDLVQTYSGMVILSSKNDPLYLRNWSYGFIPVPPPSDPTLTICPKARMGIYWQSRLFVVTADKNPAYRDSIWIGDIGADRDALYGSPELQNYFKINTGSQDRLIGLWPLGDTTLLAAKQNTIWALTDVYGDNNTILANAKVKLVTNEFGCASHRSFVQVGNDIWFLAPKRGIMSVRATEEGRDIGLASPISYEIEHTINRVNWARVDEACAATWNNRVYYALPVGSTGFVVAVYDILNRAWSGVDESDAMRIVDWIRFTWNGEQRLAFTHSLGLVMMYELGEYDEVPSWVSTVNLS